MFQQEGSGSMKTCVCAVSFLTETRQAQLNLRHKLSGTLNYRPFVGKRFSKRLYVSIALLKKLFLNKHPYSR